MSENEVKESDAIHLEQAQSQDAKDMQHVHVLSADQASIRRKVCLRLTQGVQC